MTDAFTTDMETQRRDPNTFPLLPLFPAWPPGRAAETAPPIALIEGAALIGALMEGAPLIGALMEVITQPRDE